MGRRFSRALTGLGGPVCFHGLSPLTLSQTLTISHNPVMYILPVLPPRCYRNGNSQPPPRGAGQLTNGFSR